MRSCLTINSRKALATVFGIGLMAGALALPAQADQWDKLTVLTTNQPIQVTNKVLEPGKYVFKLADSSSNRHIVQIFNGDQTHIIDTVLAIPNYRLEPTGKSRFAFWETPPGRVQALRAWFYPGDNFGQEFPYPKQLAMLNTPAAVTAPAPAPPAENVQPPQEETTTQSMTQEQPAQEQPQEPTEMAQSNPPAEPPQAEQPASAEQQPAQPEKLPKTGSPYPWFALGGLVSLGLYTVLRVKRWT